MSNEVAAKEEENYVDPAQSNKGADDGESVDENNKGNNKGTSEGTSEEGNETNEDRALRMGWVDKENFRGDKSKWVDAETFLKKGDELLPVMRERMSTLETQNKKLHNSINEVKTYFQDQLTRQRENSTKELEAAKLVAVQEGDVEQYEKLDKEIGELKEPPKHDTVFEDWVSENEWYQDDFDLHSFANSYAEFLQGKYQGKELLTKVSEKVKQEHPEKFKNQRRGTSAVQPTKTQPKKKTGKTYDDLPQEAKTACDRFIARGDMSKEEYLKAYEWD